MKVYDDLTQTIGHTPLVHLRRISAREGIKATLLAKVEAFNPGGSAKDRAALQMILDAERQGLLQPGGTIVEPTSGNTGVGLAWVAAVRGYHAVLTMPETMSVERRRLLAAYGAEIVLTPGAEGMAGAIRRAREIVESTPGAWMPMQFDNPANPAAHRATTAMEIWDDTDGDIAAFVAGVGTGGTLTGVGERLKEMSPELHVVAVEPSASPVLSGGKPGAHALQGIGAGFVPGNFHADVCDEVIAVSDDDAKATAHLAARTEGLLVGISSGAALCAAIAVARRPEYEGRTVVVLLPDTGERYLSTGVYDS